MKHFQILSDHSIWLVLLVLLSTCSSDDDSGVRTLTINFEAQVGGEPLEFESKKYLTPGNQSMNFERVKIYLSNVELIDNSTNEVFYEENSYHLLSFDAEQGMATFEVGNVPFSFSVDEIRFGIGVDAEANKSIDQVGDLDPTNGMAWDWNTGYKFLLLEGRFFPEGDVLGEEIKMHIGTDSNYITGSIGFLEPILVEENPNVTLYVNALVPIGTIDFSEGTVFMNDERGNEVARNYRTGFISTF